MHSEQVDGREKNTERQQESQCWKISGI